MSVNRKRAKKDRKLLGISKSTAYQRLLKNIIFEKVIVAGDVKCLRCEKEMTREDFSIDHIENWQHSETPLETLINSDNCGFSHKDCNSKEKNERVLKPCGTSASYNRGCRCAPCKEAAAEYRKQFRPLFTKEYRRKQYLKHGR